MKRKKLYITLAVFAVLAVCVLIQFVPKAKFATSIKSVKNTQLNLGIEITLDKDTEKKVLSIWRNGDWKLGQTKTYCPYLFVINGNKEIYYSDEAGEFRDWKGRFCLTVSDEQRDFINSIIPVNPYMIKGEYSIVDAIDAFEEKTDSLLLGYLFGGDIELAKEKMGDEKYSEYFSNLQIIKWEHNYSDQPMWESLYMRPSGNNSVYIHLLQDRDGFTMDGSKEVADDGREYYVKEIISTVTDQYGTEPYERATYTIDLGGNIQYYFVIDIADDSVNRDEVAKTLLEYGFMLKDSVPDPVDSTIKAYHTK